MQILATRPIAQNSAWAKTLRKYTAKNKGQVIEMPFLDIQPVDNIEAIKAKILDLDNAHIAIFVSQNAVHYGLNWIDQYWPQIPLGIKWFGIGVKTQEVLNKYLNEQAVHAEASSIMTSEGLLEEPALQHLSDQKVIIFRGLGGRPKLAQALELRGGRVEYCELYRRAIPKDLASRLATFSWGDDCILPVFSGESLENFVTSLAQDKQKALLEIKLVVPSLRVLDQAKNMGFKYITSAENASESEMLNAILGLCK